MYTTCVRLPRLFVPSYKYTRKISERNYKTYMNDYNALTDVKHPVQLYVVWSGHGHRRHHLIVDEQRKHGGRYLQQVYRVPEVIAVTVLGRVPKSDHVCAGPDVDEHVAVD